jgi:integrase
VDGTGRDLAAGRFDQRLLTHLSDQRRSPNTIKAYAHDLKDFYAYLTVRGLVWDRVRYTELAAFKPWLRLPAAARAGAVSALPTVIPACATSTVNRKLAAVTSFYEFHRRNGVELALVIKSAGRRRRRGHRSGRSWSMSAGPGRCAAICGSAPRNRGRRRCRRRRYRRYCRRAPICGTRCCCGC